VVCEHSRSETEKPSGTISSRSRRTSCHPRPYISDLVLRPSKGPVRPTTTPPPCLPPRSPTARYSGSCDPRRGKLSTLTPHGRGERESQREEEKGNELRYERYMCTIRQTNGLLPLLDSCRGTLLFSSLSPPPSPPLIPLPISCLGLSRRRDKRIMIPSQGSPESRTGNERHSNERSA